MLNETEKKIIAFRDARDWSQFHNPRTLSTSISIESAELLELFQWAKDCELQALASQKKGEISQELADIMIYIIIMAHDLDIDLERAILDKMERNEEKYPVDKSRGKSSKYTEL